MAKITRATQKIFGAGADQYNFTIFGTAMTNNPQYTKDVAALQGDENYPAYSGGFSEAVTDDDAPYMEDTNGFMYMVTSQLAYILQQGAAIEWDAGTTYYTGSIVCAPDGSGTWYRSLVDDNTAVLTDTTAWKQIELSKNGTPLFTQITTDYILSGNDAIGWAMQGSNVSNTVYPAAYDKILNLYNTGTNLNYRGITAKRSPDGRYIADVSQLTAVNNLYNNTGVADFYVIDTLGQSFYLPKTARFIQYTTNTSLVNQFNDSGLPSLNQTITATTASNGAHTHTRGTMDIKGRFPGENTNQTAWWNRMNGAFYQSSTSNNHAGNDSNDSDNSDVYFQASRNWTGATSSNGAHTHTVTITNTIGNSIYGKTTIVQPPASLKLLYYRVGNTVV